MTGDMPVLKSQLTDFVRKGIKDLPFQSYDLPSPEGIELMLAEELNYKGRKEGERVDPNKVSIKKLWKLAEAYSQSDTDYFLWTKLD
mgnify:CR=1 FL=1